MEALMDLRDWVALISSEDTQLMDALVAQIAGKEGPPLPDVICGKPLMAKYHYWTHDIRGDLARIYFMLEHEHRLSLSKDQICRLSQWMYDDPLSEPERRRGIKIAELQGGRVFVPLQAWERADLGDECTTLIITR
jgi:hypothetical protein